MWYSDHTSTYFLEVTGESKRKDSEALWKAIVRCKLNLVYWLTLDR